LKDKKPHTPASKENMLQKIRKHIKGNSSRGSINSIEGGIKGLKPKNKQSVEEVKVKVSDEDSSTCSNYNEYDNFLRVTFKSDFLYQIGKVCSKSAIMLERALKYLNDFLLIINFYKQDMETKSYHKLRAHAWYYIGIAFFQLGDKEMSEKFLREIQVDLIETEGKDGKKVQKIDTILSTYFTERFDVMKQCINDHF
jgi:hypothetical protein